MLGEVTFIYSTMYGNKSNHLLCVADNFKRRKLNYLLILPEKASKDGIGVVASRALNTREKAEILPKSGRIYEILTKYIVSHGKPDKIFIDECQFLTRNQVEEIMTLAHTLSLKIDCYGLRSSFTSEGFEGSIYLLLWADNLRELETFNEKGAKNTMNMLVVNGKVVKSGEKEQPKATYITGSWLDYINA